MSFRKTLPIALLALLVSTSCLAASAKSLLEELRRTYDSTRDLSGRFVQTSHLAAAGMDRVVTGKVVFKKGGKMRWTYEGDDPQEIVSDGKTLWIYQVRDRNAVRKDLAGLPASSRLALDLLSGFEGVADAFDVKACGDACLELRPRESRAELTRVMLQLEPKAREVRSVTTEDSLGNRTRVDLKDLRWNTGVKDDVFNFKPPRGVEVLEAPGGGG
ncbi:MAG: outer membrane lipoprotein chaperone LolA [Deltaproteobacteria bacterium]|nr:outer membrane lipoprotein chaperone LolA [Deltaproteobacteria bacterium]